MRGRIGTSERHNACSVLPVNDSGDELFSFFASVTQANAQLIIPHGDYQNNFEKYLVAGITFAALCFAAWRYYRSRD
jgi:hypothetical protein